MATASGASKSKTVTTEMATASGASKSETITACLKILTVGANSKYSKHVYAVEQNIGIVDVYYPNEMTIHRDAFLKITDVTIRPQEAENEVLTTHII